MDLGFGILFLLGCQLELLQLCASQTCSYGDVRLVNSTGPHEGRVEICQYNGIWKTVCDDRWSYSDAKVVCAQLHYPPEDALALSRAAFGQGTGSIIETISCRGSELRVADCPISDYADSYRCTHSEDAGVRCLSCNSHGALRLRGGSSQYRNYGRVEICVNGVWGTVCDDYWDSTDASVVCKQLGYSRIGSSAYSGARYGLGRGPIHLDNVRCRGSEQRLTDCPYINNTLGWDCIHSEDASVYCRTTLQCQEGALRLAGGRINRGRVEVCVNETWGTICATFWGQSDATVACRQLGFSRFDASVQSTYGSGTGPVHYSNVVCTGTESRLSSCQRYRLTGSCYGNKAGVHCRFDYLPSPMRFQVTCEESNLCTLSWQRPPIYYTRQGTLLNYFINCSTSTMGAWRREDRTISIYYSSTSTTLRLQPYQYYNCCVAAVNEAGRGSLSCQAFITHESAPTAAPTNIQAHQLIDNFTSAFLSWRPPLAQYQNGIIRGYYLKLNSTDGVEFQYSTQDQHLLMDNLHPFAVYTCRVAAYTIRSGPFSEPLTIVLNSKNGEEIRTASSQDSATVTVGFLSTLLAVVLIMVGVCFAVQISYKVATRKKSAPVHNDIVYETAEDPKPSKPGTTLKESSKLSRTHTAKQNKHDYRDGSLTPPLPPRTYSLSSSLDKIDNLENRQLQDLSSDQELKDRNPQSENTYQPLIPPRNTATIGSEYQSLTQFRQREVKL